MDPGLLVSIDPGLHGCGLALFRGDELEQGVFVDGHNSSQRSAAWLAMVQAIRDFIGARRVDQVVLELPQAYVVSRSKGADSNDLIQLAAVVGGLSVLFEQAQQKVYLPFEWKGQVPKEIIHARAASRLTKDEQLRISCRKKTLVHNVLDAVAMGLTFVGRMRT